MLKLNTLSLSTMVSTALLNAGRNVAPPVRALSCSATVRFALVTKLSTMPTLNVRSVVSPLPQLKLPLAFV